MNRSSSAAFMRHWRRSGRIHFIACLAAMAVVTGCAGDRAATSPTDGIELDVLMRDEGQSALYRVKKDATISFGGGRSAIEDETTWTGEMTADEMRQLESLLREHGWFEREPGSTAQPPSRTYDIKLKWPGGKKSYDVRGRSGQIDPIEAFLAQVASRRFDDFINALPQPSVQTPSPLSMPASQPQQ